jgi:hypothetical protein
MDDRYMNTNSFLAATLAISDGNSLATTDPPIACNLKALTPQQRKQLEQIGEHVTSAMTTSRDLNDGYAFRIDPTKASLMDVTRWLDLGRRCCPFYEFRIDFHAADATIRLSVEGRPVVKEYIPVDSPRLAVNLPK